MSAPAVGQRVASMVQCSWCEHASVPATEANLVWQADDAPPIERDPTNAYHDFACRRCRLDEEQRAEGRTR